MKRINNVNGIPLHYARLTNHPYGTRGAQRNFSIDAGFLKILEKALKEVFDHCPYGIPEAITTGGVYVNKSGQHGHGKAIDIDAIFWGDESLVTLNFPHQKELYLGIESFLRKHFGIVLNHLYPHHKDHWHIDTSVSVDYNETSKSETLYLQSVLSTIYGEEVIVDGVWGRQTRGAINRILERLNINTPITTKANYLKFLDITGKIAFGMCEQKKSPIDLLDNLVSVVDDLPFQEKRSVLEALNTFVDHSETSTWLENFGTDAHASLDKIIDDVIA